MSTPRHGGMTDYILGGSPLHYFLKLKQTLFHKMKQGRFITLTFAPFALGRRCFVWLPLQSALLPYHFLLLEGWKEKGLNE